MWDLDLATVEDLQEAADACGFCPFRAECQQEAQAEIDAGHKLISVLRAGQAYDRTGRPVTSTEMFDEVRSRRGPRKSLAGAGLATTS